MADAVVEAQNLGERQSAVNRFGRSDRRCAVKHQTVQAALSGFLHDVEGTLRIRAVTHDNVLQF